jgi:RNA-directed DNA polymerase
VNVILGSPVREICTPGSAWGDEFKRPSRLGEGTGTKVAQTTASRLVSTILLDEWFENEVKPRLKGKSTLVRFAEDAVMAFADFQDAKRVLDVLGKRLTRYELVLHPGKTRFVDFRSHRPDGKDHPDSDGTTFTFLRFCHVWGKSRKGKNVVRQVTAKKRYARALVL